MGEHRPDSRMLVMAEHHLGQVVSEQPRRPTATRLDSALRYGLQDGNIPLNNRLLCPVHVCPEMPTIQLRASRRGPIDPDYSLRQSARCGQPAIVLVLSSMDVQAFSGLNSHRVRSSKSDPLSDSHTSPCCAHCASLLLSALCASVTLYLGQQGGQAALALPCLRALCTSTIHLHMYAHAYLLLGECLRRYVRQR